MRKFLLLLPALTLITSCQRNEEKTIKKHYEYSDYENYKIEWKNLFFTAKTQYFVYIYSENCSHCIEIKDDVLKYLDEGKIDMFLIPYNGEIPTGFDTYKTIGESFADSVWILGVPTLIEIDKGMVVNNIAGKEDILSTLKSKSHN